MCPLSVECLSTVICSLDKCIFFVCVFHTNWAWHQVFLFLILEPRKYLLPRRMEFSYSCVWCWNCQLVKFTCSDNSRNPVQCFTLLLQPIFIGLRGPVNGPSLFSIDCSLLSSFHINFWFKSITSEFGWNDWHKKYSLSMLQPCYFYFLPTALKYLICEVTCSWPWLYFCSSLTPQ